MKNKKKFFLVLICCFCLLFCCSSVCFATQPNYTVYGNVTPTTGAFEYLKPYITEVDSVLSYNTLEWCFARTGQYEYKLFRRVVPNYGSPTFDPDLDGFGYVEVFTYTQAHNVGNQSVIQSLDYDFFELTSEFDTGPRLTNPYNYSVVGNYDPAEGGSILLSSDILYQHNYNTLLLVLVMALVIIVAYYVFKPSISPLSYKGVRL